jgi:curved DNA-binding protein CbpA
MPMQRVPDPYQVLGLARGATDTQIKAAHRALAKRYHPDASEGDARRFLRVQEAYQLLSDPLRRRDWDERHAPGPVRADRPGPTASRRPSARPPATGGPAAASRRQRPAAPPRAEPEDAAAPPSAGAGDRRAPGPAWSASETADFDVYDRSSGAAWSSAARAYFRRYDADLPRHGSFHHQGTQPLTAARARAAAASGPQPSASARTSAGPDSGPAQRPTARASRPAPSPRRQYAYAGIARDSAHVSMLRAMARRAARSARWPSLGQRLLYALLAWVPLAALIGYGGVAVAGCEVGASACPAWFVPAQSVVSALVLGLLVALPRLAFLGAAAGFGTFTVGLALALGLGLLERRPPLTPAVVGAVGLFLLAIYLGIVTALLLNPRALPWHVPRPPAPVRNRRS